MLLCWKTYAHKWNDKLWQQYTPTVAFTVGLFTIQVCLESGVDTSKIPWLRCRYDALGCRYEFLEIIWTLIWVYKWKFPLYAYGIWQVITLSIDITAVNMEHLGISTEVGNIFSWDPLFSQDQLSPPPPPHAHTHTHYFGLCPLLRPPPPFWLCILLRSFSF